MSGHFSWSDCSFIWPSSLQDAIFYTSPLLTFHFYMKDHSGRTICIWLEWSNSVCCSLKLSQKFSGLSCVSWCTSQEQGCRQSGSEQTFLWQFYDGFRSLWMNMIASYPEYICYSTIQRFAMIILGLISTSSGLSLIFSLIVSI